MGGSRSLTVRWGRVETTALLQRTSSAYRTRVADLLLAALARVLAGWSGRQRVRIALEGHGRADLFEDVDLSRTVGWFTSLYPVELDVPAAGDPGALIKPMLRRICSSAPLSSLVNAAS